MNNEIMNFKKQHFDNYKNALLDIIDNNTNALVDDDIMSLIRKPPLDSMDLLKVKSLDLAKKYKVVLNTERLDFILDEYRAFIQNNFSKIKKIRIDELSDSLKNKQISDDEIIIFYKKDFIVLNRKIRKIFKDALLIGFEKKVLPKIKGLFSTDVDDVLLNKYTNDYYKYVKGSYQRQLLENFDIKTLVKDTTLINSIKEQSEHYLFTLNHSRLFNDID